MLIDGNQIAQEILTQTQEETSRLKKKPVLAVVLVGENPASQIYVEKKHQAGEQIGVSVRVLKFPDSISNTELLKSVEEINQDLQVDAAIIQLPLPKHLNSALVLNHLAPSKDVDCLGATNFGQFCAYGLKDSFPGIKKEGRGLVQNWHFLAPITPLAVREILSRKDIALAKKEAVVVGYSNIVGKPLAVFLAQEGATVTICHDQTQNLKKHAQRADILVSATGQTNLITAEMIKPGAVVIDVGIKRQTGGEGRSKKVMGDVDWQAIQKQGRASLVTPVPGGVGPITVALLLRQTVRIARAREEKTGD